MRSLVLLVLLCAAVAEIGSYTLNCRIADIDAKVCIVCLEGYKLQAGTCCICLTGYTLQGSKCVPAATTPPPPLPKTDPTPTVSALPLYTASSFTPSGQTSFLPSYLQANPAPTAPTYTQSAPVAAPVVLPPVQPTSDSPKYVDPNCKTVAVSICGECYPSFYFNASEGKCIPVNPLCKTVTNKNQCTSCYEGYQLANGDCSISSAAVAASVADVRDRNCKNASSWGCYECYPGFYVQKVQKKCVVTNGRCKTVTADNACTSCYPGYTLLSDDCKMDSAIVTAVTTPAPSTVTTTIPATTTPKYSGSSVPTVASVNSFVLYSGFYFEVTPTGQIVGIYSSQNGSQLNPTSSSDPYCAQYSAGVCSSCVTRYYLTAQGCKPLSDQCKTWIGSLCIECASGYTLASNTCSPPSPTPSPPAPAPSPATPVYPASGETACFFRFVRVGGVCTKVDDQCREWSTSDGKCTSCYPGYSLSSGSCRIST